MRDGSRPEYAFAGGERDTSSITRFDLSLHMSSEEEIARVDARCAVSTNLSLNSCGSALLELELKRAEMRKEDDSGA